MEIPICYKNEESELNTENIWEGDLFKRKELANIYTKIITSIVQPYVISINAQYGSGKTFFLKRWAEELKQNGEKVIFFNSWDCDFVKEPLLPFLYNLLEQLKEQKLLNYDLKQDISNCKEVIVSSSKQLLEKTTGINIDNLYKNKSADTINIPKTHSLEEYAELQQILSNFKNGLHKVVSELNGKNVYIFIDELERCRPTFAIELLEAIKHLFCIKGIVFILGIDRNQLKHTISNIYGCGMDGEGYLRRFIDIELELPNPNIDYFIDYLIKKFEIKNKSDNNYDDWVRGYNYFDKYFKIFHNLYDFKLREIEQIYAKFNVITKMLDNKIIKITPVLALLMILKVKDYKLYNEFSLNKLKYVSAYNFLQNNFFNKIRNNENGKDLDYFTDICIALQPESFYELANNTQNMSEKRKYNSLGALQTSVKSFDCDRIEYLKNIIACININKN